MVSHFWNRVIQEFVLINMKNHHYHSIQCILLIENYRQDLRRKGQRQLILISAAKKAQLINMKNDNINLIVIKHKRG